MGFAMTCMVNSTAVTIAELAQKNKEQNVSYSPDFLWSNETNFNEIKNVMGKCSRQNEKTETLINDYGVGVVDISSIK